MKLSNNNKLITFRSDPGRISAIQAYMAATILQPKWDLCTQLITELRAGTIFGVFDNKQRPKIFCQYSHNRSH
jgi:uncharacterized protein (DUF1810 family)